VQPRAETAAACEARRAEFVSYVGSLSAKPVVSPMRVELTISTLGRVPGAGPVLELSPSSIALDGELVAERDQAGRVRRIAD